MAIRLPWAGTSRALGVLAVSGLLLSLGSATAQAAPATATCRAVALPLPAGTSLSSVNGGAPTGHYLAGEAQYPGGGIGVLWRDGRLVPIDESPLAPDVGVDFNAVNSRGVVVGERMTDFNSFHTDAFVYRAGRFTWLPAPNLGEETHAVSINSRGDVVGNAFDGANWLPVEWPANRPGTVRVLPTPGGAFVGGIDEDGTVVGYLTPWPPGIPVRVAGPWRSARAADSRG